MFSLTVVAMYIVDPDPSEPGEWVFPMIVEVGLDAGFVPSGPEVVASANFSTFFYR